MHDGVCVCVSVRVGVFQGGFFHSKVFFKAVSEGSGGHVIVTWHKDEQRDSSYEHSPCEG